MREEAESAIGEHGWSKASLQKMHKIDSFLKESFRLNGGASCKLGVVPFQQVLLRS
jgi:hypothetical protein